MDMMSSVHKIPTLSLCMSIMSTHRYTAIYMTTPTINMLQVLPLHLGQMPADCMPPRIMQCTKERNMTCPCHSPPYHSPRLYLDDAAQAKARAFLTDQPPKETYVVGKEQEKEKENKKRKEKEKEKENEQEKEKESDNHVYIQRVGLHLSKSLIRQNMAHGNHVQTDVVTAYSCILNESKLNVSETSNTTFVLPWLNVARLLKHSAGQRELNRFGCVLGNVNRIIAPVCKAGHWVLFCWDLETEEVKLYDTMPSFMTQHLTIFNELKCAEKLLDIFLKVTI